MYVYSAMKNTSCCGWIISVVFILNVVTFFDVFLSFVDSKCTSHMTQKMLVLLKNHQGSRLNCTHIWDLNLVGEKNRALFILAISSWDKWCDNGVMMNVMTFKKTSVSSAYHSHRSLIIFWVAGASIKIKRIGE